MNRHIANVSTGAAESVQMTAEEEAELAADHAALTAKAATRRAAADLEQLRATAVRARQEEDLVARSEDAAAPQAIRDYVAARQP